MLKKVRNKFKAFFKKNRQIKQTVFLGQEFFLPKRKTSDPVLRIKEVLFVQCSYVLFFFIIILGLYELKIGFTLNAVTSFGLAGALVLLLFYFRTNGKLYFIGFFQIVLIWLKTFVLLMVTGGIHSHMILWVILPIFLAAVYLDDRLAIFLWIFFITLSLIILAYLTDHHLLITREANYVHYQWFYNLMFGLLIVVVLLLYINERKYYQQNLVKQISMLEIQKEELHSTIEELKLQNERFRILNERLEDKQKIIENQLIVLKAFSKARAEAVESLRKQKSLVEKLLTDLEDSLKFAQILQNLWLPSAEDLLGTFPKSFIIFQQKQFVGGDFYYFSEVQKNKVLILVGDCTGHGPSGGIMSTITMIFIKELIDSGVTRPKDLIEKLRQRLRAVFVNIKYKHLLYGLEMSVILVDKKRLELIYAAAHLPILLFREKHLLEFSTQNNMIGELYPVDPIRELKIKLEKGDRIYLFSDGYYSQLNENYEKLTKLKFKKVLWNSSFEEINLQRIVLLQVFNDWKKDMEQTDDMTIIGIEIE